MTTATSARLWRRALYMGETMAVSEPRHEPVMATEILNLFRLGPGKFVIDGTLGLGGHAALLLQAIRPGGRLIGLDWDESMLKIARGRLAGFDDVKAELHHLDFRQMDQVAGPGEADAVLLDLGLNSAQVDDPGRGFSFKEDAPLDMRMDRSRGEPASAVLNRMSLGEIEQMLWDLGDERWARAIARVIIERRKAAPLRTTGDLVQSVLAAIPAGARETRIHPSTRTFQAVRIFVNRELEGLGSALELAASRLAPGGVLAVLSYHSGEDRIVKGAFRDLAKEGFRELLRKPETASAREVFNNPRSRSAKLRALGRAT